MKKIVLFLTVMLIGLQSYCQSPYRLAIEIKYDSIVSLDGNYFAVRNNNLWGVVKENKVILPCKYQAIDDLGDDVITFVENDKAGFADLQGNILIPAKYSLGTDYQRNDPSQLNVFNNGACLVYNDGKLEIINKKGDRIVGDTVEIISMIDDAVIYKKDGAYGMMNTKGEVTKEAKYMQIQSLVLGELYAYIGQRDGQPRYGIINSKGVQISLPYYDDLQIYRTDSNTFIKAYLPNGKQALYSEKGELLFQPLYQSIEPTQYASFYNVLQDTKKGIIGRDYVLYVPPTYDEVRVMVCKDTFFVGRKEDMSYILNMKNQTISQIRGNVIDIISNENGEISYIADSMLNYGVRSSKDYWKIKPEYFEVFSVLGNNIILRKEKKWGAVDMNGKEVIPFDYEKVIGAADKSYVVFFGNKKQSMILKNDASTLSFPSTDRVLAINDYVEYKMKKENVRLYLDGRELKNKFVRIGSEKDGIICAQLKDGWTQVNNKDFQPLTDKRFDFITSFNNGVCLAVKDGNLIVLDKSYNNIQTILSGSSSYLHNLASMLMLSKQMKKNYFIVEQNGKEGVIEIDNK